MTQDLVKARLTPLKQVAAKGKNGKASFSPNADRAFDVQFNPTTLKLTRSNNLDKGAATTNTQKRQVPSVQPATLTFVLEFDTAEGDDNGAPMDVRDLTKQVRQFTEPTKEDPKSPPPAVQFAWGKFRFQGIVTQLTEDLDYFSPEGRALRAKLSITITEQNPDWEAEKLGPGVRDVRKPGASASTTRPNAPGGAAVPGAVPGTGPGSSPTTNPVLTALAQAGESVQQLLTRLEHDPAAWRAAMAGLDSPLSLTAGAQVQLGASISADASVSAAAGFGVGGGFTASAGVNDVTRASAVLGISGSVSAGAGMSFGGGAVVEAAAGFVLAESGGLGVASLRVQAEVSASARASARAAFTVPGVSVPARAVTRGSVPAPDPRGLSYGRGVPLRARASVTLE